MLRVMPTLSAAVVSVSVAAMGSPVKDRMMTDNCCQSLSARPICTHLCIGAAEVRSHVTKLVLSCNGREGRTMVS
jgi:hypothetical protein